MINVGVESATALESAAGDGLVDADGAFEKGSKWSKLSVPTPFEYPLYVSRPVLPPLSAYTESVRDIFDSGILTNMGRFHQELEAGIAARIAVGHVSLWNNGTTALIGALSQLDLAGEVIVTPFTFPATVHAIALLGLTPVFADVDPIDMTLSPSSVSDRITAKTSCIVGTHIYGNSCDTSALHDIATDNSLRVVYDGAHSFGRHQPVFTDVAGALGDVTMLSFHATKLFHTVEGGALITPDRELDRRFRVARNFGIRAEDEVEGVGLNGKISELHAAMGVHVLEMLDLEIDRRAGFAGEYVGRLKDVPGLRIVAGEGPSRQYFVIRIDAELFGSSRDELHASLRTLNIVSRRYFHPLCSDIDLYSTLPSARNLPHAVSASQECLVLPLHGSMGSDAVQRVCDAIDW